MNIGKTIARLRKNLDLTQIEFAEKIGIRQTSLSQIESGKKRPNSTTLNSICMALKISEIQLYLLSFDESDVPEEKRYLYKELEGPIKDLVNKLVGQSINK